MKIVKELWEEVLEIIEENIRQFSSDSLECGASISRVEEVEAEMGVKFPSGLKALYLKNNGSVGLGAILGFELITLDDMLIVWHNNKKTLADGKYAGIDIKSSVESTVREVQFDEKWIPFAYNNIHTYLAVDLNPGEKGAKGQIINVGDAQGNEVKYVLAKDIEELLNDTIMIYEANGLKIEEEIEVSEIRENETKELLLFMDKHFFNIIEDYKNGNGIYEELNSSYNNREYDDYSEEDGYDKYSDDDDDEYHEYDSYEDEY
ncbi:SMI1/KNR4 family protein [uncultured Clostridium sp.]|uniref:SMI1/KNR4 family protein n=1 Tax=uncultured Clostridium sp. TaxID=59620 RepID=UPI0026209BCE|nr:SMI1/KNR4 family protein [uncultured Clostridium sp.]